MAAQIRSFHFRYSIGEASEFQVIERSDAVGAALPSLSRELHLTPLMPDLSDRLLANMDDHCRMLMLSRKVDFSN
jgi:hypothetical protein